LIKAKEGMADYVGFLKVCRAYQALVSMRADVLFMAADRLVIAFIADLLMVVKRCPGGKRKKEHPQHSCSQHPFDMCAFLVHLHAKLNKMPFQASSLRNNNVDTAGYDTLRLQSSFYYASMMIHKELNPALQTNMPKFTFIKIKFSWLQRSKSERLISTMSLHMAKSLNPYTVL
jgi:hypothetical protein